MILPLLVACASSGPDPQPLPPPPPPPPKVVDVGHRREFRGVWVATVANINFPKDPSASPEVQKAELVRMLDKMAELRLNAIVFQVRPEGDAFYTSTLEPWSRFLTGVPGKDPGYDPLAVLIDEAHERNIEVHAWFNPYRAKSQLAMASVSPHLSISDKNAVRPYGTLLWMDPGVPAVRDRTLQVVLDVVRRYDIDGVHFDDYFYPYPNGTEFPDGPTYAAYLKSGGEMSKQDWRRDNVHRLVEGVRKAIDVEKKSVRFGISPFGIYRPGQPEGIRGLDQYDAIYADPLKWMDEGWVDYLAPQIYWPTTQENQAFEPLLDWWGSHGSKGRPVLAGHFLSQLDTSPAWSVGEIRKQLELCRALPSCGGDIWYNIGPLMENRKGISDVFRDDFYATPALPPALPGHDEVVPPPAVRTDAGAVAIDADRAGLRSFVVYAADGDGWAIDRIVPASQTSVTLAPGRWAISAVNRDEVESQGSVVEVSGMPGSSGSGGP